MIDKEGDWLKLRHFFKYTEWEMECHSQNIEQYYWRTSDVYHEGVSRWAPVARNDGWIRKERFTSIDDIKKKKKDRDALWRGYRRNSSQEAYEM